jgi:hypothetical protein
MPEYCAVIIVIHNYYSPREPKYFRHLSIGIHE